MNSATFSTDLLSLDDTRRLARQLLAKAPTGSLIILTGPLGVGKTTLTQQLAAALNSVVQVTSPSYTLIHEYPTPAGLLIHMDAYRLPSAETLLTFGLDDYLDRARLVVVEWGEALLPHYPKAIRVVLSFAAGGRRAEVRIPEAG